jgi:hypothetical protein
MGISSATVFSTPQLFRPRDGLKSNLLRAIKSGFDEFVVPDSACGTSMLTCIIRAAPVAQSGIVADSHMNQM